MVFREGSGLSVTASSLCIDSAGRFFAVLVILLAMGTFSSFISSITTTVSTLRSAREEQFKKHSFLVRFFNERNLSIELYGKVNDILRKQGAYDIRLKEDEVQLLSGVPERLKVHLHEETSRNNGLFASTVVCLLWLVVVLGRKCSCFRSCRCASGATGRTKTTSPSSGRSATSRCVSILQRRARMRSCLAQNVVRFTSLRLVQWATLPGNLPRLSPSTSTVARCFACHVFGQNGYIAGA